MKIFIGSSQESLEWAEKISLVIEDAGHTPVLWKNVGLFTPGHYTLESLENICKDVEAAIFVFSEDDKLWYREDMVNTVRDNVLIEYGLFCGYLSRNNVCFCKVGNTKIASDVSGVTYINLKQIQRAQLEIKSWLSIIATQASYKKSNFRVMSFLDAFYYAIGSTAHIKSLKIFSIATFRVAPIFISKFNLRIDEATIMLRKLDNNDRFCDKLLSWQIDSSIELWNTMKNKGNILNLNLYRYDYQPNDGFYIIDNSILIFANIFVDAINNRISFDDHVLLVEDKTEDGKLLINRFIDKFERFKEPFL